MENNNAIKIAHTANLPTLNIKSQLNMNVDSNTHIKQVLNVETCLIEAQVEPMQNKAIVKGSIGVKVIYLDMDNMFNSISDTISFSETLSSEQITADCQINICGSQFLAEFEHDDKNLHVSIEGTLDFFCNLNSNINLFNPEDSLICKKSAITAYKCVQKVNKNCNFDLDFKIDVKINKMMSFDSKAIIDESKCYEGYLSLNGTIFSTIICEVETSNGPSIKVYTNSLPFKCEVEANECDNDCVADLDAYINLSASQITTDIGDTSTKFNVDCCLVASGFIYKNINMDIVEDIYSTQNDLEPITNTQTLCEKSNYFKLVENIDSEITLADELSVDEILGMVNTSTTITQYKTDENSIIIEGVINGNLLYLDENRETKHLSVQLPYSINTKQEMPIEVCGVHLNISPTSCKCKIKRGNILMVDYELSIIGTIYAKRNIDLISNVKYGKPFEYNDISFQIFIAHSNESMWDLCKRLHISQEQLLEFNNDLPTSFTGGEKIIIYR